MSFYEHVFIARQDLSPDQASALATKYAELIEKNGGKVAKREDWGLRTLAYKIAKNRKGYYTLLNLDAPATAIQELERQMRVDEDVIRHLTVKVDVLEEGPSAMMRPSRRDRNDDYNDEFKGGF